MNDLISFLTIGSVALHLSLLLVPSKRLNRNPRAAGLLVAGLCLATGLAGLASLGLVMSGGLPLERALGESRFLSVSIDSFAALILMLTGLVGWAACSYATRHLAGEKNSGGFHRWMSITLGAVGLAVIADNLGLMISAFILSGFSMHPLLTYYRERPGARSAARTKFIFNRVADALLVIGAITAFREFGTLSFAELREIVSAPGFNAATNVPIQVLAICVAAAAVIRSVQLPFHIWLPGTMDAPVPVSALMHAGVVNAGGIILIRVCDLITLVPEVMLALTVIGVATAVAAALMTSTQTNVKQQLALSTVAQMGFMIMQCGLGAFYAATLHILAHSAYKAYAFLNSGDGLRQPVAQAPAAGVSIAWLLLGPVVVVGGLAAVSAQLGLADREHVSGLLLGFVLGLGALRLFATKSGRASVPTGLTIALVGSGTLLYVLSFAGIGAIMEAGATIAPGFQPSVFLCLGIGGVFLLLYFIEGLAIGSTRRGLLVSLHTHAANGFYLDIIWKKILRNMMS